MKINKNNFIKKYCLITGSANGLGFEFAKIFAQQNYSLILIDKEKENLKKSKLEINTNNNTEIICYAIDLSLPDSANKIFSFLNDLNVKPEVLINNAGFGYFGFFAVNKWEKQEELINLLVLTSCKLTHLLLPGMILNNKGYILNVSSIAAFQPGPLMSVYHASKSFMLSFSLALSNELKNSGIKVSVLCPGMMATGFQKANNNESPRFNWTIGSAEKVAKYGFKHMFKKRIILIPGILNKSIVFLSAILPKIVLVRIVRKIQEKNRMDHELNLNY